MAVACASAPRASRSATALTSVDTAYYQVPGNTPAQWAAVLPRAARANGITSGAPFTTVGHVMESLGGTRTTSIGCQLDRYVVQLRLGHVMPRLTDNSSPSAEDREAWDAFVGRLWERAHMHEAIGARLADSLRAELKSARSMSCPDLLDQTRAKLAQFTTRYAVEVQEAERAAGPVMGP